MADTNTMHGTDATHGTTDSHGVNASNGTTGTHDSNAAAKGVNTVRGEAGHISGGVADITGQTMKGVSGLVGDSLHGFGLEKAGNHTHKIGKGVGDLTSGKEPQ